jgi:coatomer subunit epsilon
VALIVQIYLSINRVDLAKKQFERSKRWAEDDLLLQLIESTIGLVTGKDNYSNTNSFYTEQLGNPSLSSSHLLTARGVTRIMRGEIQEAKSDLEESLEQQKGEVEAEAAYAVAAGLGALKKKEADELWLWVPKLYFLNFWFIEPHDKQEIDCRLSISSLGARCDSEGRHV